MKESWLIEQPKWNSELINILDGSSSITPNRSNEFKYFQLQDLLVQSDNFPVKFPTDAVRCKSIISNTDPSILQRNIDSSYPLIHESALYLCAQFLHFKQKNGSEIEKKLYVNMSLIQFIQRILCKKAAAFVDPAYHFILPDGTQGSGNWEIVGTSEEKPPLILANCLSYDELKLSSFISLSSYSYFINNGSRKNNAEIEVNRSQVQQEGIVVSLIGPKFSMRNFYEYQDTIISCNDSNQNKSDLQNIFMDFYGQPLLNYEDAKKECNKNKFKQIWSDLLFNNDIYSKRLAISLDTLLLEANFRAKQARTTAYIHLVGIGLGVWSISSHQEKIFVDTLASRLNVLGKKLSFISDIHLAYFLKTKKCGKIKNSKVFPILGHPTGITIHISKREPFTPLTDSKKLLIVSYAADGNSLPGNEFWKGFFGNSSDSAMASSSQVSELHNPHINLNLKADNLRVATCKGEILCFQEYVSHYLTK